MLYMVLSAPWPRNRSRGCMSPERLFSCLSAVPQIVEFNLPISWGKPQMKLHLSDS